MTYKPSALEKAWNHAYPYATGTLCGVVAYLLTLVERSYIAPVPGDHLVWVWGLSCVAFIIFSVYLRTQLNMILMTDHGFLHVARTTRLHRRLVRLHQRAIQWCRWAYLTSFVLSAFYYLFPNTYAFPIWLGIVVCAKLLMNRAVNAFHMIQATYFEEVE